MVKERPLLQQGHNGIRKRTALPIFLLVSFTPTTIDTSVLCMSR